MDETARRAAGQLGEYAATKPGERSTGEIVADIVANAQEIIRAEVKLARVEIREEAGKAARAAVLLASGGLLGVFALGFLLWAAVFGLAELMAVWAATLTVGAVVAVISGILLTIGRGRWGLIHKPQRTVEELKENARWLKHPTKS